MFHIQSLGGVQVRDSSGDIVRLRSKKHSALLVYLAAAGRRVFTRDALARLLWDTPLERARHSLSQAIYDIRKNLPGTLGNFSSDAIRLEPSTFRFDVIEFEKAVKSGDLAAAVDLFRGPFADNLRNVATDDFERWLEAEGLRLSRLGELALRRHVRQCDESGKWGEMCVAALRLVKLSTFDEEAHRALMRGLWLHGDAASAMRHFQDVVQPLESELPGGLSEETHRLVRRIESTPAPEPWDDNLGELQTPFLGRESELETLRMAARDIRAIPATAYLIAGEAGIGKTRLAREFVRSVALEDLRLLESRCYPAEAEVPFGPVIDGLRPLATELSHSSEPEVAGFKRIGHLLPEFERFIGDQDETVDAAAWRRRLYEEVTSLIRIAVEDRPIVWFIEDVQWMDATSTSLLHYVTRRLEGYPFLLVVTLRIPRNADLPETLPAMSPAGSELTREIRLHPLSSDEIGEILRRASSDPAHREAMGLAQRLAGGNPFFALEVFRAAVGSTEWAMEASRWNPLTDVRLSKVLAIRLKGLPRQAITLLQATSVLERLATPGSVASVSGLGLLEAATVSGDLYARGLLQDHANRLEFVHDVVREYVYAGMSALQRAALHLTAAEYLEEQATANPATLARHYNLGEDRGKTYEYSMMAAREAREAGGQFEASAMAELAVQAAHGASERLRALHVLAEAELESAQLAKAVEHFNEILRLDEGMAPEQRVEVMLKAVEASAELSNWEAARQTLEEVAAVLPLVSDRNLNLRHQAESLFWTLKIATRQANPEAAKRVATLAERIRQVATSDPSIEMRARVTAVLSLATYATFYESTEKAQMLLKEVQASLSDTEPILSERVHVIRGATSLRLANWDEAEHEFRRALEYATKRNDLVRLTGLWNNLACSALEQGNWEEFENWAQKAEAIRSETKDPLDGFLPIVLNRANTLFYQGKAASAGSLYKQALEVARSQGSLEFLPELLSCMGLVALQMGEADRARSIWGELIQMNPEQFVGPQELFKHEWFRGYMSSRLSIDGAMQRLLAAAQAQSALDVPSHLKLMWIGSIVFGPTFSDAAGLGHARIRQNLFDKRLGWFVGFAQRWLRIAQARNVEG